MFMKFNKSSFSRSFINYLKGLVIGFSAIIPGVSGGTLALILGIYERLINAVGSFSLKSSLLLLKLKKSSKEKRLNKLYFKRLDLFFVSTILVGILTVVLLGSTGLLSLLETHYVYTISFFIGLIIASGFFIYKEINNSNLLKGFIFIGLGIIISLSFLLIPPSSLLNPPFWYLFVAGFFSVGALFFPGVSGSLLLLLLGVYEFVLSILSDPFNNLFSLFSFGFGLVLGALIFSKFISYLLKNYKSSMLYFLLGLVIGSVAIPARALLIEGIPSYFSAGIFFVLGFILVFVLELVAKN